MIDKPVAVDLLYNNLFFIFIGFAAFRGSAGDCESRSLSGNYREVHLSAQIQEGKRSHSLRLCLWW